MGNFEGISTKILKNGNKAIMVRFSHEGTRYSVKNFTALFSCTTEKQAFNKLQEIKLLITSGTNPFVHTPFSLNEHWDRRLTYKIDSGDWKKNTYENYVYFYDKHIRKVIGHRTFSKVNYDDLMKIIYNMAKHQGGTKNTLKKILKPMFNEAVKSGLINENPVLQLETHKIGNDLNVELRSNNQPIDIVRQLYKAIPKYKVHQKTQEDEIKNLFTMVVMTAHRIGEIMQLRKEDVFLEDNKIIAPAEITKTRTPYHFPIPEECIPYIRSIESGLLFPTVKRGSYYAIFQRLLKLTDINFYKDKTISPHDLRRLQMNVMVVECKIDSALADATLSHKPKGIMKHYLHFNYKDISEAYQQYWEHIRHDSIK